MTDKMMAEAALMKALTKILSENYVNAGPNRTLDDAVNATLRSLARDISEHAPALAFRLQQKASRI